MKKKFILAFSFSFIIIFLDQFTKYIIGLKSLGLVYKVTSYFNIVHVKNAGASFSLLANAPSGVRLAFLIIVPILFILFLAYYAYKKRAEHAAFYSFFMILSGAIANLIDRVRYGSVIDFLDFHYKSYHYPSFNVADIFITLGVLFLFIDSFKNKKSRG